MEDLGASLGWGLAVGASLLVGAVAAALLRLHPRFAAALTAFGGGVLFAAIAFELVPEADGEAGVALTAIGLLTGTLIYVSADAWLSRNHHDDVMRRSAHAAAAGQPMMMHGGEAARGESIAAGLFVDGVPESIALGLTVAEAAEAARGSAVADRDRRRIGL
jgi:ZIP family zinc transporter